MWDPLTVRSTSESKALETWLDGVVPSSASHRFRSPRLNI